MALDRTPVAGSGAISKSDCFLVSRGNEEISKIMGHSYGRFRIGRVVFLLFLVLCLIGLFALMDYLESNLYEGDMPSWIEWVLIGAFLIMIFVSHQLFYGSSNGRIQNDTRQRSVEQWYKRFYIGLLSFVLIAIPFTMGLLFLVDYLKFSVFEGNTPNWIERSLMGVAILVLVVVYGLLLGEPMKQIRAREKRERGDE